MANPSARTEPGHDDPAGCAAAPPPAGDAADASDARTPEAAREPAVDERLLRAMADLDNLRKRFSRDVAREREAERQNVRRVEAEGPVHHLEEAADQQSAAD